MGCFSYIKWSITMLTSNETKKESFNYARICVQWSLPSGDMFAFFDAMRCDEKEPAALRVGARSLDVKNWTQQKRNCPLFNGVRESIIRPMCMTLNSERKKKLRAIGRWLSKSQQFPYSACPVTFTTTVIIDGNEASFHVGTAQTNIVSTIFKPHLINPALWPSLPRLREEKLIKIRVKTIKFLPINRNRWWVSHLLMWVKHRVACRFLPPASLDEKFKFRPTKR